MGFVCLHAASGEAVTLCVLITCVPLSTWRVCSSLHMSRAGQLYHRAGTYMYYSTVHVARAVHVHVHVRIAHHNVCIRPIPLAVYATMYSVSCMHVGPCHHGQAGEHPQHVRDSPRGPREVHANRFSGE